MRSCLNPKLLMGLAVAGVGIYLLAPDLAVAALPVLLVALCPLMTKAIGGTGPNTGSAEAARDASSVQDTDGGIRPKAPLPKDLARA